MSDVLSDVLADRIIALNPTRDVETMPSGVQGQFSFARLAEILARSGELLPGETVTHFCIKSDRIVFRTESPEIER